MKKIISIFIVVLLLITLFIPTTEAFAAKKVKLDGKTVYVYTQAEKDLLVRMLWAECLNQPFLGQVSCALAGIYRYENNKGKVPVSRILRKGQFAKTGTWIFRSKNKNVQALVKKLYEVVEWAIDHRVLPKNCTMFQRANRSHWGGNRGKPRYCRIGAHTFYTVGKAKKVPGNLYIDKNGKLVKRK